MSSQSRLTQTLLETGISCIGAVLAAYFVGKFIMPSITGSSTTDLQSGSGDTSTKEKEALYYLYKKFGYLPKLNQYEMALLPELCFPSQVRESIDDIGGCAAIKQDLWETVLLPLQHPHLFDSATAFKQGVGTQAAASAVRGSGGAVHNLLSIPLGVLFYGPPGTGKTLMAKAIAKECNALFLQVSSASLESKWFGESQKIIRALFSLARKFAPAIIFIDEIDVFLSARSHSGHEASAAIKGEFMTQWDGLLSASDQPVLVIAATNRPFDIDSAILRRLPRQILFDLPNAEERLAILKVLLADVTLASDAGSTNATARKSVLARIAAVTEHYSGSDLKELCKAAAMQALREFTRQHMPVLAAPTSKVGESAAEMAKREMEQALGHVSIAATAAATTTTTDDNDGDDDDDDDDGGSGTKGKESVYQKARRKAQAAAKQLQQQQADDDDDDDGSFNGPNPNNNSNNSSSGGRRLRPLTFGDFSEAMKRVKPTGAESMEHLRRYYKFQQNRL